MVKGTLKKWISEAREGEITGVLWLPPLRPPPHDAVTGVRGEVKPAGHQIGGELLRPCAGQLTSS